MYKYNPNQNQLNEI